MYLFCCCEKMFIYIVDSEKFNETSQMINYLQTCIPDWDNTPKEGKGCPMLPFNNRFLTYLTSLAWIQFSTYCSILLVLFFSLRITACFKMACGCWSKDHDLTLARCSCLWFWTLSLIFVVYLLFTIDRSLRAIVCDLPIPLLGQRLLNN